MNIVSVLGAGGTERRGNGAGQTGRQCGRLDGGLEHATVWHVLWPGSNKQNTHITL